MQAKFSPSLMCMDFLKLKEQAEILNPLCDRYHVDIMDGHFVPNITLSPDFVAAFSKVAKKPLDCHLMVTDPSLYLLPLKEAGATLISPQAETIEHNAFRVLNQIEALDMEAGVTICPATPLEAIEYYLGRLKTVTVMTVDPGFAGQPFIEEMLPKIEMLRNLKEKTGYSFQIEVDGGCNEHTFRDLKSAGAEVFVVGSSGLFSLDEDLNIAYEKMLENFAKATENL